MTRLANYINNILIVLKMHFVNVILTNTNAALLAFKGIKTLNPFTPNDTPCPILNYFIVKS